MYLVRLWGVEEHVFYLPDGVKVEALEVVFVVVVKEVIWWRVDVWEWGWEWE